MLEISIIFNWQSYWAIYQKCLYSRASCLQPGFSSPENTQHSQQPVVPMGALLVRSLKLKFPYLQRVQGKVWLEAKALWTPEGEDIANCGGSNPWVINDSTPVQLTTRYYLTPARLVGSMGKSLSLGCPKFLFISYCLLKIFPCLKTEVNA